MPAITASGTAEYVAVVPPVVVITGVGGSYAHPLAIPKRPKAVTGVGAGVLSAITAKGFALHGMAGTGAGIIAPISARALVEFTNPLDLIRAAEEELLELDIAA